mmetsp:Transcript_36684/g.86005  ORF Transcript_36684/g.86005 Transcript_36684/m.86005 type:complete len:228 (-) Transcript_36684:1558-2241(-)
MGIRLLRCVDDVLLCDLITGAGDGSPRGDAVAEVGADGHGEERWLLLHVGHAQAEPSRVQATDVHAVHHHSTSICIVEASDERQHSALAAAAAAHEGCDGVLRHAEGEVLQHLHLWSGRVAEAHILEGDLTNKLLHDHPGALATHVHARLAIHELEDPERCTLHLRQHRDCTTHCSQATEEHVGVLQKHEDRRKILLTLGHADESVPKHREDRSREDIVGELTHDDA